MANDDGPDIKLSASGLSVPLLSGLSNKLEADEMENTRDFLPEERGEVPPQFRGKVFRVMDDELFMVEPSPPPPVPPM